MKHHTLNLATSYQDKYLIRHKMKHHTLNLATSYQDKYLIRHKMKHHTLNLATSYQDKYLIRHKMKHHTLNLATSYQDKYLIRHKMKHHTLNLATSYQDKLDLNLWSSQQMRTWWKYEKQVFSWSQNGVTFWNASIEIISKRVVSDIGGKYHVHWTTQTQLRS